MSIEKVAAIALQVIIGATDSEMNINKKKN